MIHTSDHWAIDMAATLRNARKRLDASLQTHQIHVRYIARVKDFTNRGANLRDCVGLYRKGSGRIGKPIFWINQDMPSICRAAGLVPSDGGESARHLGS